MQKINCQKCGGGYPFRRKRKIDPKNADVLLSGEEIYHKNYPTEFRIYGRYNQKTGQGTMNL